MKLFNKILMEWVPNSEGLKELLKLFKESRENSNQKHKEIYEVSLF